MTELEKQLLDVASSILADDMLPLLPAEYVAKVRSAIAAAEAAPPATVKDSLIVQQAPAGFRPDQFFAYSHEIGFELLNTAEDARSFAQQEIDEYRDNAAEGWDEAVEKVRWGVVLGKAEQIPITDHDGNTTDSSGDRFVDYVLSDCAPAQIEQQAPHKWQPIGTAPADGRTILLGHFNSHGNWRTMRGQWFTKEHIEDNWEDGDLFEAGWYETSVEADDAPSCWPTKPTHWQPLPPAPTQEAGARLSAEAKGGE
ncbi:hypothetical protein JD974_12615 [Chromobacterium haemolyticum]|uniref:DUF551 domain-containing protein n=1 Tax=Chromobacterium haemolyticum TaxID=394935 RepID=A0ABS3GNA8_9NEIS|nr:hypothetical protein [Chromobacterium haemolyticum]MBK0415249.1 hypothetical protein [Chromobacterium haemolyticum]MBO0416536.1 hypothetical protein [Chromobacterium haemolyticum]MBO0499888.1 hypothetical protein [Chromobacterium haemolyticum]